MNVIELDCFTPGFGSTSRHQTCRYQRHQNGGSSTAQHGGKNANDDIQHQQGQGNQDPDSGGGAEHLPATLDPLDGPFGGNNTDFSEHLSVLLHRHHGAFSHLWVHQLLISHMGGRISGPI